MELKYFARDALLDLTKLGPKFLVQGLRSHLPSKSLRQIDIPGVGNVSIRPGDSDFATLRQVFRNNDYEIVIREAATRVRERYDAIVASGKRPVIIDAGANIGAASLWFQQQYAEAVVFAVEPDPGNVDMLRRNVSGTNIRVVDAAIGSKAGFASLHSGAGSWAVQTERAQSGQPIVTIRDILNGSADSELFIVKVDIEGFEKDLFASDTDWIDEAFVIYVEPHDWLFPGKRTSFSFQKEIAARDFEIFLRGENLIYVR